jgi:hypothetical protein
MPARKPGNCGRAELLGIIAALSIHVVALQAKLDGKLLDLADYSSSPTPSGSLTFHSDYRTSSVTGAVYRIRHTTLNDGDDQNVDNCPGCEGGCVCHCSDEEQLASLRPVSSKYTTQPAAAKKPKQTRSRGKCTITQQTNTSNRVYCEFCFNKTGKQFSHAEIDCNRKKKFSKKSKVDKKSEKKLSKNM